MSCKLMAFLVCFLAPSYSAFANGGPRSSGAEVDNKNMNVDTVKERRSASKRTIREQAARNTRNRAFPGSFKKVQEKDDKQQWKEESNELEDLKDDPYYDPNE